VLVLRKRLIGGRAHLVLDTELWSVRDLEQIHDGTMKVFFSPHNAWTYFSCSSSPPTPSSLVAPHIEKKQAVLDSLLDELSELAARSAVCRRWLVDAEEHGKNAHFLRVEEQLLYRSLLGPNGGGP
jgi:hypothetical protein